MKLNVKEVFNDEEEVVAAAAASVATLVNALLRSCLALFAVATKALV